MSTPIIISLFCNGRQKDYEAVFTESPKALQFKVTIDNNVVYFEGNLNESFHVSKNSDTGFKQVDELTLDAVSKQLNQIFF